MKSPSSNKVKKVLWHDASCVTSNGLEWMSVEEAIIEAQRKYDRLCESVGFVIHENKDFLVIAATVADGLYSDISMIPKCLLPQKKVIKRKK